MHIACAETRTITTQITLLVYFRWSRKYYCGLLSTVSLATKSTKVSPWHCADLGGCYYHGSLVQYQLLLLMVRIQNTAGVAYRVSSLCMTRVGHFITT